MFASQIFEPLMSLLPIPDLSSILISQKPQPDLPLLPCNLTLSVSLQITTL